MRNSNHHDSIQSQKKVEKLRQVLGQEDTVLFIGSGLSQWSGLPTWGSMITKLAEFVSSAGGQSDLILAEADKGDLLQAASYGFDKLTKQQIGDFIRTVCCYGTAKPSEIHKKVVSLGPRYFITTNYDNLIEESLRQWQPDHFYRPPVTNRHLTEMAEIVHARAKNFIFKLHGDAGDSESIILTREQYRQMLPGGERQAALESLKMLMACRPVVYLGFSFRDPDFLYVRDHIANTYKGGARDHYAIMADVTEAETDYWRRNYGIHIISYTTTSRPDKTRDHQEFATLLDSVLENARPLAPAEALNPNNSDVILALARYAAGLARFPKNLREFQIRVHREENKPRANSGHYALNRYDHSPVEKFLESGPGHAILIGLPGAGKTYSLRRAAARLAEKFGELCLSGTFDETLEVVPILADLKFYRGSLKDLINQTLPNSFSLDDLIRSFKIKIFLDSFNEMPREYLETGSYELDFSDFLKDIGNASIIIGSRTSDGLDKLEFPVYCLDQIDEETVTTELKRLNIQIGGLFEREVMNLFQRPFYFQYLSSEILNANRYEHPLDFYRIFFENLNREFLVRFDTNLQLEKILSITAYDALNHGEEAFPLTNFLQALRASASSANVNDVNAEGIANWLVSSSVFIPYAGGRVAFVHQSITEYLAAKELAERFQLNPLLLKEKLSLTRWDQALFLTLSLLPRESADIFFEEIVRADFILALNAVKYLEAGREKVVSKLLERIPERIKERGEYDFKLEAALCYNLPIAREHEPHLRTILRCGNVVGGAAATRLVELKGVEVKDELLELLAEYADDYNFCRNGIANALRPFAQSEDIEKIISLESSIRNDASPTRGENSVEGFISGAAWFLSQLDLSDIRKAFFPENSSTDISKIHAEILCDILQEHKSPMSLEFAGELLLHGISNAATSIYFIASFSEEDTPLPWNSFNSNHVEVLEEGISDFDNESWSLEALKCLCEARSDLSELVKQHARISYGIHRAALLYCAFPKNFDPIFDALEDLLRMNEEEREKQPVRILEHIDFDWNGREKLFVKLMKLRDVKLASAILGSACPPDLPSLGELEIGPIDWWLEWMLEEMQAGESYWFVRQLGGMFASHLNNDIKKKFIDEFNKSGSKFRQLLLDFVIPFREDITTDVLGEDAISFLLSDLNRGKKKFHTRKSVLGRIATEKFIKERLLTLLPGAKEPLLSNLRDVLEEAGSRHGKRFVFE